MCLASDDFRRRVVFMLGFVWWTHTWFMHHYWVLICIVLYIAILIVRNYKINAWKNAHPELRPKMD